MSDQQVECPIQSEALILFIRRSKNGRGHHALDCMIITYMHCYYLLESTRQHGLTIPPTMAIEKSKDEKHQQHDKALMHPKLPRSQERR